jgi:hypothetical protein
MRTQSAVEKNPDAIWPFTLPNATDLLQARMKTLAEGHSELLDETGKAMTAWAKRRQEAIGEASRTFRAVCACKDPAAVMAIYRDWLTGSMARVFDDVADARKQVFRLAEIGHKALTVLWRTDSGAANSSAPADNETEARKGRELPRIETSREDAPGAAAA